ncbi:hypothetical protein AYO44_10530 [Planctomycetaceae bacterium SCGC AG-212-F19]|nr:hypothetical protein AYO44_10530 [Planctomycetaceae bacterium SCGC AG-212-F19]
MLLTDQNVIRSMLSNKVAYLFMLSGQVATANIFDDMFVYLFPVVQAGILSNVPFLAWDGVQVILGLSDKGNECSFHNLS